QDILRGLAAISATYFDQSFDELIEYVPGGPPNFKGTYGNLRGATSRGMEVELRTAAQRGWSGRASVTWLRAVVSELAPGYTGTARVGDELLRRPRKTGGLSLLFTGGNGASSALSVRHLGKRPDLDFRTFPSKRVTLPGVTVADLAGMFPLVRSGRAPIALTLRVDNIFDKRFQEVFNFDAPGRRILLGGRIEALLR
ncbi:MAG TPA: TonB-dependent receptor, partial [Gemmatimonadaceae bacterium]|nr:TonB-dependent receptor [Gemmatimonadaceae bacterium]